MMMPNEAMGRYAAPPRRHSASGRSRTVGLELELGHLGLDQTLEIVRQTMGGEVECRSRTEGVVRAPAWGTFKVEVDSAPLKERNYLRPLAALGLAADSAAARAVEESVLHVAREFVPLEVVTPPISWDRLHELDPMWAALRAAGAEDTHSSLLHAFGLHFNPELPDFEVATALNLLRAFLLLEDWIMVAAEIDLARRIAPYIRPFPEEYRRKALAPAYRPTWSELVEDYLRDNPTRNRPLDLLPLFAHLGLVGDLARYTSDAPLVRARPTLHYRLPNCELARPGWTPAADWNRWVMIERVADDTALLRELAQAYLSTSDLPLRMQRGGWVEQLRQRLGLEHLDGGSHPAAAGG